MSIADKKMLLKSLENVLGDVLTCTNLIAKMKEINNELDNYDINSVSSEDSGAFDLISAFITAKRIEGRSEKTLERYKYIINRLLNYVKIPINKINVYHIREYLTSEKNRGICESTLEGYREVYSSVFGWLFNENLLDSNPCINLGTIKIPKKIRKPYSDVDMEYIRDGCSSIRDKAIVYFLKSTGCRVGEMCILNKDDINLISKECIVRGKGDKERTVYFDNVTAMILNKYFETRTDDNPALFISEKQKKRLNAGGVRFILKSIEKKNDNIENVHPHRFRRTLATNLVNAGMAVQDVAAILGHENLNTTMKYVHQSKEHVKSAYNKCT